MPGADFTNKTRSCTFFCFPAQEIPPSNIIPSCAGQHQHTCFSANVQPLGLSAIAVLCQIIKFLRSVYNLWGICALPWSRRLSLSRSGFVHTIDLKGLLTSLFAESRFGAHFGSIFFSTECTRMNFSTFFALWHGMWSAKNITLLPRPISLGVMDQVWEMELEFSASMAFEAVQTSPIFSCPGVSRIFVYWDWYYILVISSSSLFIRIAEIIKLVNEIPWVNSFVSQCLEVMLVVARYSYDL